MALLNRKPEISSEKVTDLLSKHGINNLVMENWINDTLSDAEHLAIPGVILQPEHKNPITRYGIDRNELTLQGIPNDQVDRIYRSLFVYSVGFFELIKKTIQHSSQRHSLITRLWKAFSVLLEYCCSTDYKMMIAQINSHHEDQTKKLKA